VSPPRIGLSQLLERFRPGATIYIPGASGELACLRRALIEQPERLAGVELVSCLVPGMNVFDYAGLHEEARLSTFLLSPALRSSFKAGRIRLVPLAYSAIAQYLAELAPDIAILHVTPPQDGLCSFGTCADFGTIVAGKAKVRIGVINTALPRPRNSPTIPLEAFDAIAEVHEPPPAAAETAPSADLVRIGVAVAKLVPNGAAIQTGIGQAPAAVWAAFSEHRNLRLRSGMVTNGFIHALEAGALAPDGHVAGVAFGDARLYDRLDGSDFVRFADARTTHGVGLTGAEGLVTINSALEVDLFGQMNLEWIAGRLISGVGGAPDFCRAGRLSRGGRSIVALPSSAREGAVSRIVPQLQSPSISLPRDMVDTVVTEHGEASVRELCLDARAETLIEIAAPQHREDLARAWRELRAVV